MSRATRRLATLTAPETLEIKPRATLSAEALADRAAVAAMLTTWDTLTATQLRATLKRLVRYFLEREL